MDTAGVLDAAARDQSSCSAGATAATISASTAMGAAKGVLIDYYTSYDIMPNDSFVGYAGIIFTG